MRHVLFARPHQLDRDSRHLLGDQHRLLHIVGAAAPAEAAAEDDLVEVAFRSRQAGGFDDGRQRRLAVLARTPDLATVGGVARRCVHRLHRGVILERIVVDRLHLLDGARDGGWRVAGLVADIGLVGIQTGLDEFRDRGARRLGVLARIPNDRQRLDRGLCMPERVSNHGNTGVADLHHLLHPGHAGHLGGIEALDLAAIDRRILDGRDQQAGHLDVDAVDLLAGELVEGVEPLDALAGDLPILGVLELDVLGGLELGGRLGHLAESRGAPRRLVGDHAVGGVAFRGRDLPFIGGGLDQHFAGGGSALADIFVRGANAAAAAGREIAPHALACQVLSGGGKLGGDLRPVAFELLGDQLGEAGERALAHLGARDPNDDGVVRLDHHPGIDLGRAVGGAHHLRAEREREAERKPATGGGGADHKGATIHSRHVSHGCCLPVQALAAA
jgi:hypothetical protein